MKRSLSIVALLLVGCMVLACPAWAGGAKHLASTINRVTTAYDQEWSSYLTYRAFAKQAEHEEEMNAAVLFRALAEAELAHTGLHAAVLRWAGQDPSSDYATPPFSMVSQENLEAALKAEQRAVSELYTPMLSLLEGGKEPEAARAVRFALAAEMSHAALCEELIHHNTLVAAWG
ncbi:MAG: ferritin family protein, partial [Candidatus Eisenbacteria bacterium]